MGRDFFDDDRLAALLSEEDAGADLTVVYGVGAALAAEAAGGEWETDAFLAYLDVPKNEIQYRSAAGSVRNVGVRSALGRSRCTSASTSWTGRRLAATSGLSCRTSISSSIPNVPKSRPS
jgi:hypothetical protein